MTLNIKGSTDGVTRTGKREIAWDDQDAKDGLVSALLQGLPYYHRAGTFDFIPHIFRGLT